MAYTEKFTKLKDFNPLQLHEALALLGLPSDFTVWFMGFDEKDEYTVAPADFTDPHVVVKTPSKLPVSIVNAATKGEIHVLSGTKLTAQQVSDIDAAMDAHDKAVKSAVQLRKVQKNTDLSNLRTKLAGAGVTASDLPAIARLILEALE